MVCVTEGSGLCYRRHELLIIVQDSLAIQVPPELRAKTMGAQYLYLEFWSGTTPVGICELPIQSIVETAAEQVGGSKYIRLHHLGSCADTI